MTNKYSIIWDALILHISRTIRQFIAKNTENKKWTKIHLKWPYLSIFSIDPIVPCLRFIQVIGMPLLFEIKELQANLLPKILKGPFFNKKKATKSS